MSRRQQARSSSPAPEQIIVAEAPKFDIESYLSNYEGPTRLNRLLTIGLASRTLGPDALRVGIQEAKRGKNVKIYQQLVQALATTVPSDPLATLDQVWVDRTEKETEAEAERLMQELKGYKNNLIKESIRMGNEDLGAFYYETGDYNASTKAFNHMREYCTTPKHVAEMSLKTMLTAIAQDNWMPVQAQIYKVHNLSLKPEDNDKLSPILSAIHGLYYLATGQYRSAVTSFTQVNPSFATVEPVAGVNFNKRVLTANDVAVYGGLCALASMDRSQLRSQVLENQSFRSFLELEPHIRRAITSFCSSKYTQCLEILETYKADFLLDVYLQKHVATIYSAIRRKSIVTYFKPFSRVSIASMAEAFKVDYSTLENELVHMIRGKVLDARLDKVEGVLVATTEEKRRAVLERALATARDQEKALRIRMWRVNMMNHGFTIKAPKGKERLRG